MLGVYGLDKGDVRGRLRIEWAACEKKASSWEIVAHTSHPRTQAALTEEAEAPRRGIARWDTQPSLST